MIYYKNLISIIVFFLIIFAGTILRLYNLNFDNFWTDEMVTFWVSDPNISLKETIKRNFDADSHFLLNYFLKIYFTIFSYNINLARYLTAVFGIFSIFLIFYLSLLLKEKRFLFLIFLFSANNYLIQFSQELRSYSLIVLLTLISLIFFFKITDEKVKKKKLFTIFFILTNILIVLTHIFGIILIFSFILFETLTNLRFKKKNVFLRISNLTSVTFSFFFVLIYILNFTPPPDWIPQIKSKFFTNFFFSSFFGSRMLGLFHLILLIYLIAKSKMLTFRKYDQKLILLIFLFFSYLIPITYGYFVKPILQGKYIIFVIIPVLVITVNLIDVIKREIFKKILIFLTILFTITNISTESTVKQFFFDRPLYKPDLKSVFDTIAKSQHKDYSFNIEKGNWTSEKTLNSIIKNYSIKYTMLIDLNLNFQDYNNFKNKDYLWMICLTDLNQKCDLPGILKNKFIVEEGNFNKVNIKLIKL